MAKVHVHEFLAEIPVRHRQHCERMFHDSGCLDRLGCGQNVLVGLGNVKSDLVQDVLAHHEVLGVGHERDRHDLAVDGDQLVLLEVLPVLGDQIVKRPDEPSVQERHDGRVGNDRRRVFRRIRCHGRDLYVAMLGRVVLRKRDR